MSSSSTPGRVSRSRFERILFLGALLFVLLRGWYLLIKMHDAGALSLERCRRCIPGISPTWGRGAGPHLRAEVDKMLALDDQPEEDETDLIVPTKKWIELMQIKQDLVFSRGRLVGDSAWLQQANETTLLKEAMRSKVLTFKLPDPRKGGNAERLVALEAEFLPVLPPLIVNNMRFNTCAVVGNSGMLKGRHHGSDIDAHDAVFRINYAPTVDFERDVGQKVSFDLINKENSLKLASNKHKWRHPLLNSTVLLFETHSRATRENVYMKLLERMRTLQDIYRKEQEKHCEPLPSEGTVELATCKALLGQPRVWLVAPTLVDAARVVWMSVKHGLEERIQVKAEELEKRRASWAGGDQSASASHKFRYHSKPMSGMIAVYFSLQVCTSVTLYGFEPFKDASKSGYHYFDRRQGMTDVHSFNLAIDVFKIFATQANLKMVP